MGIENKKVFDSFDMIESALMKIEYADLIAVMLLHQSNFDKRDEIVLSALLNLIPDSNRKPIKNQPLISWFKNSLILVQLKIRSGGIS